ncbi:Uncharacterised protein [Stenotrophomonas maltophilia]|nr:Uncharacterised protein [Stenotrophomonas maltophilia]
MRIGGGSVGSSHALLDPINQGHGQCALRLLLAGQRYFGQRTRQRVVGAVAALGICALQCDQQLLSQRVAGGRPGTGLLDQLHACIAQQLTVAAYFRRLRQHGLQQLAYFGGRGIGLFGRCQGQQGEAALEGSVGCGLGQLAQHILAPAFAGQSVGVHFPAVVTQHLPVFCGQSVRRCQRGGQGSGNSTAAARGDGQCPGQFGGVIAAGHAGDFVALWVQHDQGRIAAYAEALAPGLRTFLVAIQVDGNEFAGQRDESRVLEQAGLELVARRAPDGAPVQQHRLAAVGGLGEGIIDVALAPGDSLGRRGRLGGVGGGNRGRGAGAQRRSQQQHGKRDAHRQHLEGQGDRAL